MPKRKQNISKHAEEVSSCSESEGFSSDYSDYEPTATDIAATDAENYDSEDGQSVEDLDFEFRQDAVLNPEIVYMSKDKKIKYSTQPKTSNLMHSLNNNPGNKKFHFSHTS